MALAGDGFLVSQLGTLGVACFAADRLWYRAQFSAAAWCAVFALWVALAVRAAQAAPVAGPRAALGRRPWLALGVAVVGCAVVLRVLASGFSWLQAGAFGLMLLSALGVNRVLLGIISKARRVDVWEGLRLAAAQGAAVFAVHPYVRSALLGAGDALSYSMAVADFLTQWRAGIFPVLVGQSPFAISGGFQPLRNAPFFTHLAWVLDLLSLGTLNVFALQNLAVLASMLGGVLGCYAALRISLEKGAWVALGLSVLFGLCPGVLAPLYGGDLYITFMTLPFLPWLVLGLRQSSATPRKSWPWALQGGSLAGMWLAHPPVAAWATLLAGFSGPWILIRERKWGVLARMILALGTLLVLGGYLFVSVRALGLPGVSRAAVLSTIDFKMAILRDNWASSFLPVSGQGNNLLGDLQLGYGLWACLLAAAWGAVATRSSRPLAGCLALILLFAWPVPVLTRLAWGSLPSELLVVTNQWPTERFYLLLAAVSVFIAFPVLAGFACRGPRQGIAVGLLLSTACLWSAAEASKFFRRAEAISHSEGASEDLHRPENIRLSRTHSYEYLGTPAYFSDGHMDPRLETRLLDRTTLDVFADGSTPRAGLQAPRPFSVELHAGKVGLQAEPVSIDAGKSLILRFDFLGRSPEGELQMAGGSLYVYYSLPESGRARAFGSGPGASHTLILENTSANPERISFRFVPRDDAPAAGLLARVTVDPLEGQDRAIRLDSLTPFRARVRADRDCYLETPKLFVPGYVTRVDGAVTPFVRSPNGLLAIALPKGDHDVSATYVGSRLLRWSYYGCAGAWLALLGFVGACSVPGGAPFELWVTRMCRSRLGGLGNWALRRKLACAGLGAALAAVAVAGWFRLRPIQSAGYGDVHMVIRLPMSAFGLTEPLLTTGRTGAGDFIYVTYVDGGHIVVGHDRWAYGGSKSAPVAVDYAIAQRLEIGMDSLYHATGATGKVFVRLNGAMIFSEDAAAYPSTPKEVTIGENTIGGSTTLPRFSGEILQTRRGDPAEPR